MHIRHLVTFALVGLLSLSAIAKGPGKKGGEHPPMHHIMKDLNLTEDQKSQLKKMHEKNKGSRIDHKKQMKEIRDNIKGELAKDTPDAGKLKELARQTSDLVTEKTQKHIDHLMELKKILSKDQFQKLLERDWVGHGGKRHKCDPEKCDKKNCPHKGKRRGGPPPKH